MIKSPLKYAGSKARILPLILERLPDAKNFYEPFVGAFNVFLNITDKYENFYLSDLNSEVIRLFNNAKYTPGDLLSAVDCIYEDYSNSQQDYLKARHQFNPARSFEMPDYVMSALLIYLNRHCFNGLYRVNKSGEFNVPFGKYKQSYKPKNELRQFINLISKVNATATVADFEEIDIKEDSVIYLDPPYEQKFTSYTAEGFGELDQQRLVDWAVKQHREHGAKIIASNSIDAGHRYIEAGFEVEYIDARRSISRDGSRRDSATEIIASLL